MQRHFASHLLGVPHEDPPCTPASDTTPKHTFTNQSTNRVHTHLLWHGLDDVSEADSVWQLSADGLVAPLLCKLLALLKGQLADGHLACGCGRGHGVHGGSCGGGGGGAWNLYVCVVQMMTMVWQQEEGRQRGELLSE